MSSTPARQAPDVRQLSQERLPETAFPGGRNQTFRVFLDPGVHTRVWKHSADNSGVEICGVLVGRWARDANGPFVLISECIPGEAAQNKFAEVTFTHETWAKINQQMDTRFADFAIVGWYHSHPSFGIFLSDRDRFIQEHFFSNPGQVAYVVDPVRRSEGMFSWQEGKPTLLPHYWVGPRVQVSIPAGEETAAAPKPTASSAAASGNAPAWWLSYLSQCMLLVAVFLLGFLFAGKLSDLERHYIKQEATARALVFLKVQPGLREELDRVREDLQTAGKESTSLAREHLKLTAEPADAEARWKDVLRRLDDARERLLQAQLSFCPGTEESAFLRAWKELQQPGGKKDAPEPAKEKTSDKKQ
jgi:proteasome lid subunit RPN8/RPN11